MSESTTVTSGLDVHVASVRLAAVRADEVLDQHQQDALVRARAWRCQQRLYRRWRRMAARGKPGQTIVVACARELAGFVWAIATDQPLRAEG